MNTTIALQTSLPTEVILYILTFLDGKDIVRFGATNLAFSTLYKKSSLLQSLVQLDLCGVEACVGLLCEHLGPGKHFLFVLFDRCCDGFGFVESILHIDDCFGQA